MTIKEAAQDALDVQNACNVSGVVLAFARCMEAINEEKNRLGQGSDFVRNHPITILFVNKLEDMTGSNYRLRYSKAHDACANVAEGKAEGFAGVDVKDGEAEYLRAAGE